MATLLTKKSDTASSVPLAGDLTNAAGGAELAVNTADKKLYVKNSSGTVVELTGLKPTDIGVSVQAYDAQLSTLAGASADRATYLASNEGFGFRNRIINGDMRIDQRNNGASVTPTDAQYSIDRWQCFLSAASKYSVQQNAGSVTPPAGFTNYLGVTSLSAYSVLAASYFNVGQKIEGFNVADLAWGTASAQPITFSFWVRSSLTGTFGGSLSNSGGSRTYPFTYTISSANTWEQKTVTVAGDTSGTWLKDNGKGLELYFGLGVGSTYSGTAGSWSGSYYISATGATSVVGTSGATFYITGVQLEAGTVASPFERRDYGRELIMCQRYCQVQDIGAIGYGPAGQNIMCWLSLPVVMRASPTAAQRSNTGPYSQINVTANTSNYAGGPAYISAYRSLSTTATGQFWEVVNLSAEL